MMPAYIEVDAPDLAYWYRARKALDVASYALGIPDVELRFIAADWRGEHQFDYAVDGFELGGAAFILDSLAGRRLVEVVFHEVRHCWQHRTGRYRGTFESAERDAQIWVLEQRIPLGDDDVDRWVAQQDEKQLNEILRRHNPRCLTDAERAGAAWHFYYARKKNLYVPGVTVETR